MCIRDRTCRTAPESHPDSEIELPKKPLVGLENPRLTPRGLLRKSFVAEPPGMSPAVPPSMFKVVAALAVVAMASSAAAAAIIALLMRHPL